MQVVVRADVELADGAAGAGEGGDDGGGDPLGEDDLAADVLAREVGGGAVADIDEVGGEAGGGGGSAHGMGDGGERGAVCFDPGAAGEADIGVVQDDLGGVAVFVEAGLDVAQAFGFVGGAGEFDPAGEGAAVVHQQGARGLRGEGGEGQVGHRGGSLGCGRGSVMPAGAGG